MRAATDLALRLMDLNAEGNDAVGYRLQARLPVAESSGESWYVVKENGRYRVLAVGSFLPRLGAEALRRMDQGDIAGAQQWLDWARDALDAVSADGSGPRLAFPLASRHNGRASPETRHR